jgi:hypothetical protein
MNPNNPFCAGSHIHRLFELAFCRVCAQLFLSVVSFAASVFKRR